MKSTRLLSVAIAVALLAPFAISADEQKLPADVQAILDKADMIELLSLEPTGDKENKDAFHGYKVLGKTTLKGEDARKVITAVQKGIKDSKGIAANCFQPRHGIRATVQDKTVELVICYQCLQIVSYIGDKEGGALTTAAPAALLNKVLKDAKVPLPKN